MTPSLYITPTPPSVEELRRFIHLEHQLRRHGTPYDAETITLVAAAIADPGQRMRFKICAMARSSNARALMLMAMARVLEGAPDVLGERALKVMREAEARSCSEYAATLAAKSDEELVALHDVVLIADGRGRVVCVFVQGFYRVGERPCYTHGLGDQAIWLDGEVGRQVPAGSDFDPIAREDITEQMLMRAGTIEVCALDIEASSSEACEAKEATA